MIYLLGLALLISAVVRAWRQRGSWRSKPESVSNRASLPLLMTEFAAALFVALAIWIGAPMFRDAADVGALRVLAGAIVVSAAIGFVVGSKFPKAPSATARISVFIGLAPGLGILICVLYLRSCPADPIRLEFPLRGKWRVITGGRSRLTNYHHGQPPQQNYAVDLVAHPDSADTLGQPVVAPCVCQVDRVSTDTEAAEGNLIVLKTADKAEVWLAHLKDASIVVGVGDSVTPGQQLAQVGDTGSAESAHLHIHVERQGRALPVLFSLRWLVRGDTAS